MRPNDGAGVWDKSGYAGSYDRGVTQYSVQSFPVKCMYIPSGMKEPYEKELIKKLQTWAKESGDNLYAGIWNIGDWSYKMLINELGFHNRPMIVLTRDERIVEKGFFVVLDDPLLLKDFDRITELLPKLLDLFLRNETKEAARLALKNQKETARDDLIKRLKGPFKNVKLTISGWGCKLMINT